MQIRYAFFVDVFFANVWLLKNYGFSFLVYFMRQSSKPLFAFQFSSALLTLSHRQVDTYVNL